ncbi:MAG: metallophosphoesterase [Prevotella sp.]|nr:metallophosphoesterase [Prevotella sp.]
MKLWALVFFLLPLLGCAYVGWHVWRILPLATVWKWVVVLLMAACFALFILNFVIGLDRVPLTLARVMYNVGNSTLFILLYLFMLFLALDVVALVLHFARPSLGDEMRMGFLRDSLPGTLCVLGFMVVLFTYANLHYLHKVRVPMEIDTKGKVTRPLKLVLMSDLHLGYHNSRAEFAKWVDKVNAEQPDLVLIAGDIIDISVRPLLEENVADEFKRIKAPIYACLGNHEYYSGEPRAQKFYRDAGIHLLRDSVVTLPDYGNLTIIGRDDRTNGRRAPLSSPEGDTIAMPSATKTIETPSGAVGGAAPLLRGQALDGSFSILLDHQPYHLERTAAAGIDFQFSGHTHYGQVWPISWIEDAIYECAYGSLTKGNTRFYVTSGIGIWGGKFRIGTQSEYVVLTLK